MNETETTALTRPNGKPYRPRIAGLQAHAWSNEARGVDGEGCIVFGSLDVEVTRAFADQMVATWYGSEYKAGDARPGWFRAGYSRGEPMWLDDPVKGRPGVMWEAVNV